MGVLYVVLFCISGIVVMGVFLRDFVYNILYECIMGFFGVLGSVAPRLRYVVWSGIVQTVELIHRMYLASLAALLTPLR